jgi:predicted DNA-binding transcriptional regulator YafY
VSRTPVETSTESLGWSVTARLRFLEELAWWTGGVNRRDIVERFGISEQQASGDFTRYQELAPANLAYDKSGKTYRPTAEFKPVFFGPDSAETLGQFRLIAENVIASDALTEGVTAAIAGAVSRPVDPELLRIVLQAIRERRRMSAFYVSLASPDGKVRTIEPHAIVFDGFRWHARAFVVEASGWRDFVLGRLSRASPLGAPSETTADDDADWQDMVQLTIAAHPGLSPAQRRLIERDYGMHRGKLVVTVRKALQFYTKLRLGLDLDGKARAPEDQHIVLVEERVL